MVDRSINATYTPYVSSGYGYTYASIRDFGTHLQDVL